MDVTVFLNHADTVNQGPVQTAAGAPPYQTVRLDVREFAGSVTFYVGPANAATARALARALDQAADSLETLLRELAA